MIKQVLMDILWITGVLVVLLVAAPVMLVLCLLVAVFYEWPKDMAEIAAPAVAAVKIGRIGWRK